MRLYLVEKDRKKREKIVIIEKEVQNYKSIVFNRFLDKDIREEGFFKIFYLTHKNYISQIKNRCNITGRGRAINSSLRISKYAMKMIILRKMLKGYLKGSW